MGERRGRNKGRGEKKEEKEKEEGFSKSGWSGLSHFKGGFPKVLSEGIPGFRGRKEGRRKGEWP